MTGDPASCWRAAVTGALLAQARWLSALSVGLLLLALAGLVVAAADGLLGFALCLLGSLLFGTAALWLSLRVGFDAALFSELARRPDLEGLDAAMIAGGLVAASAAGRPLDARIAGATGLLHRLLAAVAVQATAFLAGTCLLFGWSAS